jgi:ATP-dependent Lon protease
MYPAKNSSLTDSAAQPPAAPTPNPDEQSAMARGDMPMKIDDSLKATMASENEAINKMNVVAGAESLNIQNAVNGTTKTGSGIITDHGRSTDQIRRLGEKIEQATLPKPLSTLLIDRISRLALIRQSAGFMSSTFVIEYEQTSRYVNWIVDLPWDRESTDLLDLTKAKEAMDKSHYGLEPLKQRVLEYIASLMLNIKNNKGDSSNFIKSPILCIVGLAGTGKTTFAKALADSLGRSFERIAFGGMADSRVLRGQSRFFPDAEPGAIIKKLTHAKTKNPVICLDELDRITDTARADIMGVLVEILDPEQNANFTDHYIDYPFSLQNVLFVATANNISNVSTAVLDRLEIIHMPSYTDEEKIVIGRDFVLAKTMKVTGLLPEQLQIDPGVWDPLIRPLGYDPGIRGLDRLITNICRKAAMLIISGQAETVRVTPDNIKQFMPEW